MESKMQYYKTTLVWTFERPYVSAKQIVKAEALSTAPPTYKMKPALGEHPVEKIAGTAVGRAHAVNDVIVDTVQSVAPFGDLGIESVVAVPISATKVVAFYRFKDEPAEARHANG